MPVRYVPKRRIGILHFARYSQFSKEVLLIYAPTSKKSTFQMSFLRLDIICTVLFDSFTGKKGMHPSLSSVSRFGLGVAFSLCCHGNLMKTELQSLVLQSLVLMAKVVPVCLTVNGIAGLSMLWKHLTPWIWAPEHTACTQTGSFLEIIATSVLHSGCGVLCGLIVHTGLAPHM